MSHATLERQIQSLPEDCLDEVSRYIEYVMFRWSSRNESEQDQDLSPYYGSITSLADGMELQRRARDEWA